MSPTKLPASWPTYVVKCVWDSTAILFRVKAKSNDDAVDRVKKQLRKVEGGDRCREVYVERRVE